MTREKKQLYFLGEIKRGQKVRPVYWSSGTKRIFYCRVGRLEAETIVDDVFTFNAATIKFSSLAFENPKRYLFDADNSVKEKQWKIFFEDQRINEELARLRRKMKESQE